jgi:hypothetical protein
MADKELEAEDIGRKVHDLAESMERVRTRQTDRDDVVVDLKHARVSRLEILADNLKPVFNALPEGHDQFEFALSKGETPRLWIDMTSFVRMGGDGREYEFVKDTRLGRTILGRTSNVEKIGERISDYVAERVLERERMIEGDWIAFTAREDDADPKEVEQDVGKSTGSGKAFLKLLFWFVMGIATGLGLLYAAVRFRQLDTIMGWFSGLAG